MFCVVLRNSHQCRTGACPWTTVQRQNAKREYPLLTPQSPSLTNFFQIVWFNNKATDNKLSSADVSSADKSGVKLESKLGEEKKEGSDDEDIEEEERSWRRGYDAE